MLIAWAASPVGGWSPHTSLTSTSVGTTCPALISRAARTGPHFSAPTPCQSCPAQTSRGPSSRNLIIDSPPAQIATYTSCPTMTLSPPRLGSIGEGAAEREDACRPGVQNPVHDLHRP